jgi:hypothetical protein
MTCDYDLDEADEIEAAASCEEISEPINFI